MGLRETAGCESMCSVTRSLYLAVCTFSNFYFNVAISSSFSCIMLSKFDVSAWVIVPIEFDPPSDFREL